MGVGNAVDAHIDRKVRSEGFRTVGVVTDVNFYSGARGSEYKVLTITFLTTDRSVYAKGFRERYNSKREGSKSAVSDELHGNKMIVYYDQSEPSRSVIEDSTESYTAAALLITFSAAFGISFIHTGVAGLRGRHW